MSASLPAEPVPPAGACAAAVPDTPAAGADSPVPAHAAAAAACANCGAPLTGRYCSECGQRHHEHPVHHFWHFVSEATEDLTHADSRLWQTLTALLFRPGFLTREFLEGRRVRYLPPVRLYLVVSVIFFVLAGLQTRVSRNQVILADNGTSFRYQVVPAGRPVAPAPAAQAPARAARDASGLAVAAVTPAAMRHFCTQAGKAVGQYGGWFAPWGGRVTKNCLTAATRGGQERLQEAVTHNLERAMFLLLPLLALAMKPLYLKPPRHYVEHLLLLLHNHAFLFVMFAVMTLAGMITSSAPVIDPIDTVVTIYIPIYFYRAMRRVYGQSRGLTLGKLGALGVVYFCLGMVMLLATVSYSFLTL